MSSFRTLEEAFSAVAALRSFSDAGAMSGAEVKQRTFEYVKALSMTQADVLTAPFRTSLAALDSYQVEVHGLVLLYVFNTLLRQASSDANRMHAVFAATANFINLVHPKDLQYAPECTKTLALGLLDLGSHSSHLAVMLPLVVLAQKSALAHVISPIHPLALRACIQGHNFKLAARLLTVPKESITKSVVVRDVLLYHYYGGIVMASLKRYDEAIQLFEFTLTVPSRAVSAIQVAAYKKLVLVSAIARGSIPTIPKMGPSPVPGAVRAAAEIYHDLVRAMSATDGRLEATLANHALKFQADDNLGLARQAVTSAQIHALRRLTDVYVTVSLREAARALGTTGTIAGAERLLVRMIDSGAVIASITHDDSAPVAGSDDEGGMVHFQDDVCAYDGVDGVTDLVARISATLAASERARDIDYKLIAKAKKSTPRMADHEADYMGALGGSFLEDRMDLS